MLALKGFFPSSDKVRQVEFHPVLPWAVSATKSDAVTVWDWRTKQVVWEGQFGGGSNEDDLCADAEMARLHLRDAAFAPNPSLLHPLPSAAGAKKEPAGRVRDVHFLDCDVAQVQLTWQHTTASGCGSPPPRAEDIKLLRGHRLLVIACDNKILVVDLASHRVLELGKGMFEGKSPSAVAFLFRAGLYAHPPGGGGPRGGGSSMSAGGGGGGSGGGSGVPNALLDGPVLAVGCSDGVVRCVQLFPVKPMVRLVSAHKTPVVAMAVMAVRGIRFDTLVVGHQGGRVVLYEPMGRTPGFLSEGPPPRAEYKAHEKELLPGSLAVVPVEEDPETTRFLLFSAGSDHRVCGLDPASLKGPSLLMSKIKVDRTALTCMAHWPRGWVSSGVHSLLLGTESGHLLLAHPLTGSVRQAADLDGMVPTGQKRTPKVYGLFVHPMMPNLVAAATNTGVAVLIVATAPQPLAAAPLPLTTPAQALRDDGSAAMGAAFGGAGGAGTTYVTAIGKNVLCVTAAVLPNQDMMDFPPNQVMGKLQVSSDSPGTRALVSVSHDGGYVAVTWPGARQYVIYRQGASSWQEVTKGVGTSIGWHSSKAMYAVVEEESPPSAAAATALAGKLPKDSKKAEKAAAEARAAMEAAAKAAAASAAVRLRSLQGGGAPVPYAGGVVELRGDAPSYVQGGPLLAVTVRRTLQTEAPDLAGTGGSTPALLLYDWETGRRVGPELPDPLHLAWDPSRTMMALAYPTQLLVVRSRPDFQVVSTLPIAAAESLQWSARQLFVATPTHIICALLAPNQPHLPSAAAASQALPAAAAAAAAPARLITLAAPGVPGVAATAPALSYEGFLPPPAMRPPGPLALLGPRDGCLWMVGVLGQPMALTLNHPGLRCCSLVAAGDLNGAVSLAGRALAPELHDQLAALMVEMDGLRGAQAAVYLSGISLQTELRLHVASRNWQQAVEAAEALLQGFTRRPPPGHFRSAASAAAYSGGYGTAGGIGLGGIGGSGPHLGDEFVDYSLAAGGPAAAAPAHPEDLDWTQPLRAAVSSAKAAATATVATGRPGGAAAGAAPSATTVQLVLGLLADLQRAALYDVVRHLARPLLAHAVHLSGEQMRSLAVIMAQAGMKTELPSLAHSAAAGADSCDREQSALLAAALSGHTALVQDSLREDGAATLAALQARVYGLSTAADSMAAWRRQLAAAGPAGAAPALGRLDVAVPV